MNLLQIEHTFRNTSNTSCPAPARRNLNASVAASDVAEETSYANTHIRWQCGTTSERCTYEEESQVEVCKRRPGEEKLYRVVDELDLLNSGVTIKEQTK